MCRQRCALIVARCACAYACMSARVNACSSTAGLDLTTSSGDHRARARARPNDTASLVVRQRPLPPRPNLPICSSGKAFARAPRAPPTHLNGKTSPLGSSSDDFGSRCTCFLVFSKSHLRRSQNRLYHHDHAVSIGSVSRPSTSAVPQNGLWHAEAMPQNNRTIRDLLISRPRWVPVPLRSGWTSGL